ncbi:hypothetical protein ABXS75_15900 [Roseburia hominis]
MQSRIPGTYQEWLDLLKRMQKQPVFQEELLYLEQGKIMAEAYLPDRFQTHVTETVDVMLRRSVKRYDRARKEALEAGEIDSIPFLCIRLKREMEHCYFYRHIRFLESEFVERLDQELSRQILLFWEHEAKEFRRLGEETLQGDVEELYYFLKRMQRQNVGEDCGKARMPQGKDTIPQRRWEIT